MACNTWFLVVRARATDKKETTRKKDSQPVTFFPDGWLSFFLVVSFLSVARATLKKEKPRIDTVTGITDTNFLSNATGNGDRKCI